MSVIEIKIPAMGEGVIEATIIKWNVKVGDFILIDESRDGAWDHLGFVTSISPSSSTYIDENGVSRTYYNFKVAQHSSNYHAFVNSSTNNWEQKNTTRIYGILKR